MLLGAQFFFNFFFFSSRRRHTRSTRDWSSDVCSSDLKRDESQPPGGATSAPSETHAAPRAAGAPNLKSPSVDDIRRLADLGRLEDAARSCEVHLRQNGASAELFYLLGLIHDAVGDRAKAAASYRKALYLDPDHREALEHLAALLDSEGD